MQKVCETIGLFNAEGHCFFPTFIINNKNNYKTMKTKRFFFALAASVMLAATTGLLTAAHLTMTTPW